VYLDIFFSLNLLENSEGLFYARAYTGGDSGSECKLKRLTRTIVNSTDN
jgi:hypothetical protein